MQDLDWDKIRMNKQARLQKQSEMIDKVQTMLEDELKRTESSIDRIEQLANILKTLASTSFTETF